VSADETKASRVSFEVRAVMGDKSRVEIVFTDPRGVSVIEANVPAAQELAGDLQDAIDALVRDRGQETEKEDAVRTPSFTAASTTVSQEIQKAERFALRAHTGVCWATAWGEFDTRPSKRSART